MICDLEDLCPYTGVAAKMSSCLERCKSGPNCMVYPVQSEDQEGADRHRRKKDKKEKKEHKSKGERRRRVVSELWSFEDSLELLSAALGTEELKIPEAVLHRSKLRSDAVRLAANGLCNRSAKQLTEATSLLTQAIALESAGSEEVHSQRPYPHVSIDLPRLPVSRLCELRLLRGELLGSQELGRFTDAVADLDAVIAEEPIIAKAWMAKAKVLRRSRQTLGALACLQEALRCAETQGPPPEGKGLSTYEREWIVRNISQLEDRAFQEMQVEKGEFGDADASDTAAKDSGNGSGWWKVVGIAAQSWDSCVYHLENHPPAVPHPCPHDSWHVRVCIGKAVREYTPVSTATEWEQGTLKLLVKTYLDGNVSKRFASLQVARAGVVSDEHRCWLQVSAPVVTLKLPSFDATIAHPITHFGLVVGGTGIAPALQILREVANPAGAFGAECRASLLYSSRSQADVLMLDELREVEAQSHGRILVKHTLSNSDACSEDGLPHTKDCLAIQSIPDQHHRFASRWSPYRPKSGPLQMGNDQEAGFRGRVTSSMLAAVLPAPGIGAHVVVSGPPGMWEDISATLLSAGHLKESLTHLKGYSVGHVAEMDAKRARR